MEQKNIIYFNLTQTKKKKTTPVSVVVYLCILAFIGILNLVAWLSVDFCDWHTKYVFPIWINTYGRFTSLFPFSVGEVMLILGVVLLLIWIVLGIACIFLHQIKKPVALYSEAMLWIILAVGFIMTQNCAILYHTSTFEKVYPITTEKRAYTVEELAILRDYLTQQCNVMAEQFEREENGDLIYQGDFRKQARLCMQALGETYPRLAGYYINPKFFTFSEFFSQQYIMGYYFPFSLESHINKLMYVANFPATACHELAHTKGFMYEADANFISFLACTQSEDAFFQYCGYLSVLTYVDNDYFDAIGRNRDVYRQHEQLSSLVRHDDIFLTQEAWNQVHKKAVLPTETVKAVSNELMDTSIKMNGIPEGIKSYNKVVALLLQYYDGTLY